MPIPAPAVASLLVGLALVVLGLWVMRSSAMPRRDAEADRALPVRGMSFATRSAVGLSLMLAGYHAAAWGTPDGWIELRVPRERWYLVVGGIAVAVGVSVALDRLARDGSAGSGRARDDQP